MEWLATAGEAVAASSQRVRAIFAVVVRRSEMDKLTMFLDLQTPVRRKETGLEIASDRGDLTGSLVTGTGRGDRR